MSFSSPSLTRRHLISGIGATALSTRSFAPSAYALGGAGSLGQLAAEKGIQFGASFATRELGRPYSAQYIDIYEADARIITSDVEFKLNVLRRTPDAINFAPAEQLVDFALHRQMKVRGHTLIWNDDMPEWINALPDAAVADLLDSHITTVLRRFKDRVGIWDVVNEPIGPWDRNPGNLRGGPFYRALGEGYIDRAFRVARAEAPTATLVLNEAQMETADQNGETFRTSFMALLRRLKEQGTPIDAIGIQSHLQGAGNYDFPAFAAFLSEIAAMSYAIHITEMDVNDTGIRGPISARDAKVASLYEDYLNAVLAVPAVTIVQLWQMADPTSWMRDPETARKIGFRGKARPLIYDEAFKRKPSWYAIQRALRAAPKR